MGFVWVHADSFFHCVASPFQSFVTNDDANTSEAALKFLLTRIHVQDVKHLWLGNRFKNSMSLTI